MLLLIIGELEISGTAEIYSSAKSYATLSNKTTGTTKITGGKITSVNSIAIRQEGILEISGGDISTNTTASSTPGIYTYADSDTKISGGKISSSYSLAVYNNR